jgi:hypothetical protein
LLGCRRFGLTLLLDSHVMANGASDGCACDSVMTREVATDAAYRRATQAASCERGGSRGDEGGEEENLDALHESGF